MSLGALGGPASRSSIEAQVLAFRLLLALLRRGCRCVRRKTLRPEVRGLECDGAVILWPVRAFECLVENLQDRIMCQGDSRTIALREVTGEHSELLDQPRQRRVVDDADSTFSEEPRPLCVRTVTVWSLPNLNRFPHALFVARLTCLV